ncbi:MAG: S1/P1 Nuclease [Phenylobacterium sp.]
MSRRLAPVLALLTLTFAAPEPAQAWGAAGHRMVSMAAMEALPPDLPAFLRSPSGVADVGELSREPDRSKGSGRAHSISLDSGHFLDVYDDGTVMGGPRLEAMPPDREAYETALRAAGTNAWKAGWLYYAILETQQQLTKDFAMWRVLDYAGRTEKNPDRRAWLRADLRRREALILQSIGRLSHYVADGSQPLHVTHRYNGWGEGPNPEGFTQERIHSRFEGELVASGVRLDDVRRAVPATSLESGGLEAQISGYLASTWRLVPDLYRLEKAGGLAPRDPRGVAFASARLGAGAGALRDFVEQAWKASLGSKVGWPEITVKDALSGRSDIWTAFYGKD